MPRFTLVIPTTDRPSLLPAAVRAALASTFDDIEVIVSDNFSRLPATHVLGELRDARVRCIRTDRRLAVSDHWEFIWKHVTGEYVMFLGDDNALHPDILALADLAIRKYGLEVVSWRAVTYFHPDWDIVYPPLPDRGNILGVDPGTTRRLYRCDPHSVLENFGQQLRLSGCFPCMLNFLFPRERAEAIRVRMGRFFWAPNPDISCTVLILGTIAKEGYGFFDGFGAIGGRSRDSNIASLLSRGKRSRRVYDYIAEFGGQDPFPYHQPKFVAITNSLAAALSQAIAFMPELFGRYAFDQRTLAMRTIDDIYVSRTVPWGDDPKFLDEVERFIRSLPEQDAAECLVYRERCADALRRKEGEAAASPQGRNAESAVRELIRRARGAAYDFARSLWGEKYWEAGGTTYIDLSSFGAKDIAGASARLPEVLRQFDRNGDAFVNHYRSAAFLGEVLDLPPDRDGAVARLTT